MKGELSGFTDEVALSSILVEWIRLQACSSGDAWIDDIIIWCGRRPPLSEIVAVRGRCSTPLYRLYYREPKVYGDDTTEGVSVVWSAVKWWLC